MALVQKTPTPSHQEAVEQPLHQGVLQMQVHPVGSWSGGRVEDAATGSAAAASAAPCSRPGRSLPRPLHIRQGDILGHPSFLTVDIPSVGGIVVKGTAMPLEPPCD
jgi:hypothetical protein